MFERQTALMVETGNDVGARSLLVSFLTDVPLPDDLPSAYHAEVYGYLWLRLGGIYYRSEEYEQVQSVYIKAGPYIPYADTLARIRFYRWASTAYSKGGNDNMGLTMINRSMYLADAIGDTLEFDLSRGCWRALAADSVIVEHSPAGSTLLLVFGAGLVACGLFVIVFVRVRSGPSLRSRRV